MHFSSFFILRMKDFIERFHPIPQTYSEDLNSINNIIILIQWIPQKMCRIVNIARHPRQYLSIICMNLTLETQQFICA